MFVLPGHIFEVMGMSWTRGLVATAGCVLPAGLHLGVCVSEDRGADGVGCWCVIECGVSRLFCWCLCF